MDIQSNRSPQPPAPRTWTSGNLRTFVRNTSLGSRRLVRVPARVSVRVLARVSARVSARVCSVDIQSNRSPQPPATRTWTSGNLRTFVRNTSLGSCRVAGAPSCCLMAEIAYQREAGSGATPVGDFVIACLGA